MNSTPATATAPPAGGRRWRPAWPWSGWTAAPLAIAALVALPLASVLAGFAGPPGPAWAGTPVSVILGYAVNSLVLVVGVVALTTVIGVATGWLVAACDFPGRRFWAWALVVPLAFPGYIAAYGHGDLLDRMIPLIVWVRGHWGVEAARACHDVLRYGAVMTVLASVLYPYVYLAARTAFTTQGRTALEAARTLGCGPAAAFFRVSLPLARPALAAGALLVAMEVLNDYGAVAYFGVPTFTVGIFRFWLSFGDPDSAVRVAAAGLLLVFALLGAERWWRGRRRFAEFGGGSHAVARYRLSPRAQAAAVLVCAAPVAVGFLFPLARLAGWAWTSTRGWDADFLRQIVHTFLLAAGSTLLIVSLAVLLAYAERVHPQRAVRWVTRFSILGYALPAAILALGLMRGLGRLDTGLTAWLLSGTVGALGFAYAVRFLAVAFLPVQAGLKRICGDLDAAARCLGSPPARTLRRVNLPLLGAPLQAAAVLVFIDVLKELPLTLLLRPFNFETLGTRAFNLVDQGRLQQSAPACLLIVATALACILVLHRLRERAEP